MAEVFPKSMITRLVKLTNRGVTSYVGVWHGEPFCSKCGRRLKEYEIDADWRAMCFYARDIFTRTGFCAIYGARIPRTRLTLLCLHPRDEGWRHASRFDRSQRDAVRWYCIATLPKTLKWPVMGILHFATI